MGRWRSAVVLGTGLIGLMCAVAAAAQEPSSPPPPAGGHGHEGTRYHELLPDIGRIGAQAGVAAGPSWNPYHVGAGAQVAPFLDPPPASNPPRRPPPPSRFPRRAARRSWTRAASPPAKAALPWVVTPAPGWRSASHAASPSISTTVSRAWTGATPCTWPARSWGCTGDLAPRRPGDDDGGPAAHRHARRRARLRLRGRGAVRDRPAGSRARPGLVPPGRHVSRGRVLRRQRSRGPRAAPPDARGHPRPVARDGDRASPGAGRRCLRGRAPADRPR